MNHPMNHSMNHPMDWYLEHWHRDGSVHTRIALPHTSESALRIGRALDNDVVLDDPHCAPYHAVLRRNEDGSVTLHDLGSINGLRLPVPFGRSQCHTVINRVHDQPDTTKIQIGNNHISIRHTDWSMAPEAPLSNRMVWPLALLALLAVLLHETWTVWLNAVHIDSNPPYLAKLSGLAAVLAIWSTGYSLLGRILGGVDRFFSHLLIVCIAYLSEVLLQTVLEQLAFSFYWLWPLRIANYMTILILALVVRAHLRLADPRHWAVTRWGVGLSAFLAISVPIGQMWITSERLTNVQLVDVVQHPMTRLAEPISMVDFMESVKELQRKADLQRQADAGKDDLSDEFLLDDD